MASKSFVDGQTSTQSVLSRLRGGRRVLRVWTGSLRSIIFDHRELGRDEWGELLLNESSAYCDDRQIRSSRVTTLLKRCKRDRRYEDHRAELCDVGALSGTHVRQVVREWSP